MNDLVNRLRAIQEIRYGGHKEMKDLCYDAADELERLQRRGHDLRAAAQRLLDACKGGFFFPPGERERARQLSLAIAQLKQEVEASR